MTPCSRGWWHQDHLILPGAEGGLGRAPSAGQGCPWQWGGAGDQDPPTPALPQTKPHSPRVGSKPFPRSPWEALSGRGPLKSSQTPAPPDARDLPLPPLRRPSRDHNGVVTAHTEPPSGTELAEDSPQPWRGTVITNSPILQMRRLTTQRSATFLGSQLGNSRARTQTQAASRPGLSSSTGPQHRPWGRAPQALLGALL